MGNLKQSLLNLVESSRFPLVVSLPANRLELARAAISGGADAIKVHIRVGHRASGHHFGTLAEEIDAIRNIISAVDVPVGIVPGAEEPATPAEMEELEGLGIDFLDMYWHHLPSYILTGTQIKIAAAIDGVFQHEELPLLTKRRDVAMLEASIMDKTEYGKPLNLRDLVTYELITRNSFKPVLVPTQKQLMPSDLPLLQEIGVKGVIMGAIVTGTKAETIEKAVRDFKEALS